MAANVPPYSRPDSSEDSNAPRRRLAAGGATQQLRGSTAGSLALAGNSPSSRHGVPSAACRPQQHGSPSQRCRGTRTSGCPPCLGRPVRVHMSSVRPSSVRRPVRVQHPRAWCPRVRCPVPGVRVQCERPASVSTLSAPVSSWSAWVRQAATRLETGRPGNCLTVEACLKIGLTA